MKDFSGLSPAERLSVIDPENLHPMEKSGVVPGTPPKGGSTSTTPNPNGSTNQVVPLEPRKLVAVPLRQFVEAGRVDPEPQWVVQDYVPGQGSVSLIAPPGAGKTFFALVIVKEAVAKGRPVLIVEEEGSRRGMAARVDALQIPLDSRVYMLHRQGVRLDGIADFQFLKRFVTTTEDPVLIVDPFASLFRGDENGTSEMNAATHILGALLRLNPKLLLVVLHHMSKSGSRDETSALYAGRGSTTLVGWTDTQLNLTKTKAERGTIAFILSNPKQREAEEAPQKLVTIRLGTGEVTFEDQDAEERDGTLAEVRAALEKDPDLSVNDVYKRVGGTRATILKMVNQVRGEQRRGGKESPNE